MQIFADKRERFPRLYAATELVILAVSGVYLVALSIGQNTFPFLFPTKGKLLLLALLVLILAVRWMICPPKRKMLPACAAILLIYCLDYAKNRYNFLLFLAVLTIAFADISWRRLLKMYLASSAAVSIAAILCSFAGVIDNLVYIGNERIRSSWGICYPTDLAATVLYILFVIWILSDRYGSIVMLPIACLFTFFSSSIPDGKNSRILGWIFAAVLALHVIADAASKRGIRVPGVKKIVDLILQAAFPICAGVMLFLTWAYEKRYDFAVILSNTLHGRPQTGAEAYEKFGLHLLGTPFEQIGGGGNVIRDINYFFIDSTSQLLLFRYGIAVFLLVAVLWVVGTRRAIQAGNYRVAWVMALICAHSFLEHHFTEVNYNIFLVMTFAAFGGGTEAATAGANCREGIPDPASESKTVTDGADSRKGESLRTFLVHLCIGLSLTGILVFIFPRGIALLRTAGTLGGIYGSKIKTFGCMLASIAWTGAFLWLYHHLCTLADSLLLKIDGRKSILRSLSLALCGAAALCLPFIAAIACVQERGMRYKALMEEEAPALSIAVSAAPGRVYVSDLPDVYRARFGGIGDSYLLGEDMARLGDVTILLPDIGESEAFIASGFLYLPLSQTHALYSDDIRVIDALEEAGYHMTGYYSRERQADMRAQAWWNTLETATDGSVLVTEGHPMIKGPRANLFAGRYTIRYTLHTDEAADEDVQVGTLQVTSFKGEKVHREVPVYRSQFDAAGDLTLPIVIDMAGSRDVDFVAEASQGHSFSVRLITWQRTPAQDVHAYYDEDRRKIREEYYDMNGEPILSSGGYFALDYGYDRVGNVTELSYFDTDNEPVLISAGYARITRTFDRKKQKLSEAYFGTDGEPVSINNGYASIAWEYDRRGNAGVIRYYDEAGEPVMTVWGYAEVHRSYDRDRRITEERYFDAEGESCTLTNGQAGERRAYDDDDHLTGITYIDGEGKPFMIKPGYAMIDREYNAAGQVIREAYRDAAGEPVAIPGGYAATEREFDGSGRTSMMKHYDAAGEPYEVSGGYVSWRREYDTDGNVTRESYFDETGAPIANTSGFATIRRIFDDQKHCLKETYYDAADAPVTCTGGYYGIDRTFDGEGHVLLQLYIDQHGRPMVSTGRYAWWERTYDDRGDPVEERYYGRGRKPVANSSGIAVLKRIYDDNHLCVREAYFDLNGKLVNNTSGFAILRRIYNGDKRVVREERYGKDGKAAAPGGVFAIDSDYNERGQLILQGYTDKQESPVLNGNGIAGIRYGYDAAENRFEDVYLDAEGNPCAGKNRIAIVRRSYLHRRNAREIYYDVDEKPVTCTGGYAGIVREYDDIGNQVMWIHIDPSGKPAKNSSGVAIVRREFDEARNCVYEAYFDEKGLPCNNNKGISVIRRTFDADRRVIKEEQTGV